MAPPAGHWSLCARPGWPAPHIGRARWLAWRAHFGPGARARHGPPGAWADGAPLCARPAPDWILRAPNWPPAEQSRLPATRRAGHLGGARARPRRARARSISAKLCKIQYRPIGSSAPLCLLEAGLGGAQTHRHPRAGRLIARASWRAPK